MPNLNLNETLTNHELLTELQKRIQTGTIAWEVQTKANDPLSRLFDLKVNSSDPQVEIQEENNSSTGFNQNTLLWVVLGAALFLFVWKKSYNLKVNLIDKSP